MGIDISVVVPFYDAEEYIGDCIDALLSQSYPADRYEVIMVNNNSTDGSVEIVGRYPRVKLLSEAKQGAYAARNRGIVEARGDVVVFTDPDCVPVIDWLENLAAAMDCAETQIVLGGRRFGSDDISLSMLVAYETEKAAYVFSSQTREIYYGYTNNMAVRRSLFEGLGPFLEIARGADTIFVRRTVDEYSCDVVCYSRDACVRHLEITRIWDFYRKQLIYGRSNQTNDRIRSLQPLSAVERLWLFKCTVKRNAYSVIKSALLFLLLSIGGICYELGRWQAIRNLRRGG